jgi:uncharacterized Ntn-hydrolase superfamily protein
MTFSIVARCAGSGQLGVASTTGTPGVGKYLTWARRSVGAIATQAWVNPYLGIDGLSLLEHGHPAAKVRDAVVAMDDDRALRQVAIVDAEGGVATWTGEECSGEVGERTGPGFAVVGNLLESLDTLDACADRFAATEGEELVERLIRALEAGEEAGGDRRGARSATAYVVATEEYPLWDIRVDDDDEPLVALRQVQRVFAEELLPQIQRLPTRVDTRGGLRSDDPSGLA